MLRKARKSTASISHELCLCAMNYEMITVWIRGGTVSCHLETYFMFSFTYRKRNHVYSNRDQMRLQSIRGRLESGISLDYRNIENINRLFMIMWLLWLTLTIKMSSTGTPMHAAWLREEITTKVALIKLCHWWNKINCCACSLSISGSSKVATKESRKKITDCRGNHFYVSKCDAHNNDGIIFFIFFICACTKFLLKEKQRTRQNERVSISR